MLLILISLLLTRLNVFEANIYIDELDILQELMLTRELNIVL